MYTIITALPNNRWTPITCGSRLVRDQTRPCSPGHPRVPLSTVRQLESGGSCVLVDEAAEAIAAHRPRPRCRAGRPAAHLAADADLTASAVETIARSGGMVTGRAGGQRSTLPRPPHDFADSSPA